jgi:hypothetical protein
MRLTSLKQVLKRYFSFAPRVGAKALGAHRVIALCRESSTAVVEQIIAQFLMATPCRAGDIVRGPAANGCTRVVLSVSCTETDHLVLVRLISRLGLEADVRSVLWEHVSEGELS